jgi:D-xylose 1-dehydrogenase (NADP+, D-xylono-1,5-lactone-forming)
MSEQVQWGVMGNATIARVCVIPAIQRSRNGVVRALASRTPEKTSQVAATNEIPHVYGAYGDLLEDPDIDAVYIPLPNHLHHPWTLRALSAGKHVLCEKPLACSAQQAQDMASSAAKARLLLMEAYMYRFHPRSRRIQKMVASGELGVPRLVRCAFCYRMEDELLAGGGNVRLKPEMGGGALLDVGCYGVSVARWLFGTEPLELQAQAVYYDTGVDVHTVGLLRFANGALATVEASFMSTLQQTYTVAGDQAAIELPHDAFIPWEKDAVFTLRAKTEEVGKIETTPGVDEYQLMVEHFADAVVGKTALDFSPQDSVGNMRALDGLAQAAKTGRTVKL